MTSFGYAYLIAAAVVGVSASSLGLVTAVPLTRIGLEPRRVARQVEASSWPALLLVVAATAGIFAVAGAEIAGGHLGSAYGDDVGAQIGQARRRDGTVHGRLGRPLGDVPPRLRRRATAGGSRSSALGVLVVHVPLAFAGQAIAGLTGSRSRSRSRRRSRSRGCSHSPRGPVDYRARLAIAVAVVAGCTLVGFVPAGRAPRPGGGGVGRARARRRARSRSAARRVCPPHGTTCESSHERQASAAVVLGLERAGGHPRVPPLAGGRATYPALSVVVVDNASDGRRARLRSRLEFPGVSPDPAGQRTRGFAGGVNVGVAVALEDGADAVLLLNNDATAEPGFLEPLVEAASVSRRRRRVRADPRRL